MTTNEFGIAVFFFALAAFFLFKKQGVERWVYFAGCFTVGMTFVWPGFLDFAYRFMSGVSYNGFGLQLIGSLAFLAAAVIGFRYVINWPLKKRK